MSHGIELKKVSKSFRGSNARVEALKDVSFELRPHENTAILGPSGCGKSTALRLIAGLDLPDSGKILLDDKLLSKPSESLVAPHLRRFSMVFQDLALWPGLSAIENVILGLAGKHLSRVQLRDRALAALTLCRIDRLKDRQPSALSGGQQQRVALARALAVEPEYLLLDEPFSGLDLVIKLSLLDEIRELVAKRRTSVILVTHDPIEAASLCQNAIVLENGRVMESGQLTQLLRNPASETLRAFKSHQFHI